MRCFATRLSLLIVLFALASPRAYCHPGHGAAESVAASQPPADAVRDAITGSGDLRFRYRADLSELPPEIATGIKRAHGGFAKGPDGELYFGLEGTGVVRVSPDLREKRLFAESEDLRGGGLHNTTYLDRDGGLLALPDNVRGQVLFIDLDGDPIATIGRPPATIDALYGDPAKSYAPTDADAVDESTLLVTDGYGPSKCVLAVDLERRAYIERAFGGPVGSGPREAGKFSTPHGVTWDGAEGVVLIADRERQWVQKFTPAGNFVGSVDTAGANPCDYDVVEWRGKPLGVVGCLRGPGNTAGVVQMIRDGEVVSSLRPKADLGLEEFEHIHNAIGVVVDGQLFVLCYGWNPGCYAVLQHVAE
ncbi:MAG: hypothetical protein AAF805_06450 [Planctomycetota bacterium]